MIHFVGAGPGAPDLITVRGARLLTMADVVIYAGSLVNPEVLALCSPYCEIHDSAGMTLEETVVVMREANDAGKDCVRLHTGDPALYGAIAEQMVELDRLGISYDVVPGVSSLFGAAAALRTELTQPGISQSLIITRAGIRYKRNCWPVAMRPTPRRRSSIVPPGPTRPCIGARSGRFRSAPTSMR